MASSRTRTVVGLDIEPSHIAAAQVRVNGTIAVERVASAPLEPGLMREGEVADADQLGEALKAFFRDNKLPRRVRLGVANQRIVMRTIELPPIKNQKELAAAIRFQAQEHIPMPLEHAVLDWQSLGVIDTPEGPRTQIVLVAARRDMVERLLSAVRRAGLRAEGIDLSAFAMIRALHHRGVHADDGVTLYVHVGGMTNLALAEGTSCLFTRVAPSGVEMMAGQLAERRGLTIEHARQWLRHVGLEAPLEDVEGDPEIVTEARSVLVDGARRVADDIRNSIDFYASQAEGQDVSRTVLTGPALGVSGFTQQLSADLKLPIEPGMVAEARPGALDATDAGTFTIAAGLAIEAAS